MEKYIGDAVMALFGAPVATETDALRCVRAGLDLQRVLARSGGDRRQAGWAFRVGVATGEALVDVAAAHDGGQAIVAGDVVNTASRLQSRGPARRGAGLRRDLRGDPGRDPRTPTQPPVTLRGRAAPTEVWLALAAGAAADRRARVDATAAGRPRPRARAC